MKTYTVYECEFCESEFRDQREAEYCESQCSALGPAPVAPDTWVRLASPHSPERPVVQVGGLFINAKHRSWWLWCRQDVTLGRDGDWFDPNEQGAREHCPAEWIIEVLPEGHPDVPA